MPQSPSPFSFASCCAAAGIPLSVDPTVAPVVVASEEQVAELELHGRNVLRRFTPAQLATALYAAVYVEQLAGRLAALDLDEIEGLSERIQLLEHEDEQAGAS